MPNMQHTVRTTGASSHVSDAGSRFVPLLCVSVSLVSGCDRHDSAGTQSSHHSSPAKGFSPRIHQVSKNRGAVPSHDPPACLQAWVRDSGKEVW